MIKVERIKYSKEGFEAAIRGMRNSYASWDKSDSDFWWQDGFDVGVNDLELMHKLFKGGTSHRKFLRMIPVWMDITAPLYWWKQMETYKVGTTVNSTSTMHSIEKKAFTQDDFSKEHLSDLLDSKTTLMNEEGCSFVVTPVSLLKMTIVCLNHYRQKYLETKDKLWWWQMIQLLPDSYNQKRTVSMNYENVANIIRQRRGHRLDEWDIFCDIMLEELPYLKEIMNE